MSTLQRAEQATAWELRAAWADQHRKPVVLILSERCMTRRVQGLVEYVAVTGAYVIVDGWHIPTVDVLAVHRPHHSQGAGLSVPPGDSRSQ